MTHMISDNNSDRGDRPVRKNINKIVMGLLLLVVIAIILTIIVVGTKGKNMHLLHKSEVAPIAASTVA